MIGGKIKKFNIFALVLIFGFLLETPNVFADTKISFDEIGTIIQEIKFKGDFRLRHENFENSGTTKDRQRQRMRLRIGADLKLPNNLKVKSRLASGEDDQVSTNQTLTDNADPKSIFIDRAFLEWTPIEQIRLAAGKQSNPFWGPYSNDIMWDSDYNPEGASEHAEVLLGPIGVGVTLGQFAIEEESSNLRDVYLFSEQLTLETKLPAESRIQVAVAHHEFANIKQGSLDGAGTLATNTPGTPFSILQLSGILSSTIMGIPVSVETTWIQNNAAVKTDLNADGSLNKEDSGTQAGLIVGKASKKGSFELAGFVKEIEKDAAVAGITDSDFPNTTNAKGWLAWVSYAITDYMNATIKHFDAEKKVVVAGAADGSVNRTQFDLALKF